MDRIIKTKDLRTFIKIKPDLYDFRKEQNSYDCIPNLEIYPLYSRTRVQIAGEEKLQEVVDWEKRQRIFEQTFCAQIWYAYEKARKLNMNYQGVNHRAEDWDFEKNGFFHRKFSLQDENLVFSSLPKVEEPYLQQLEQKDEEFH